MLRIDESFELQQHKVNRSTGTNFLWIDTNCRFTVSQLTRLIVVAHKEYSYLRSNEFKTDYLVVEASNEAG